MVQMFKTIKIISLVLLTLTSVNMSSLAAFGEPVSLFLKSVRIAGQTNVNKFYLTYNPHQTREMTLPANSATDRMITFRIPVKKFESQNPLLTQDFIRFMRAGAHPYIEVMINKKQLTSLIPGTKSTHLPIKIDIAGQTQKVQSQYHTNHYPHNQMHIVGFVRIHLKDFNLEPPQKMMGLVQVQEKISIQFDVILSSQHTASRQ